MVLFHFYHTMALGNTFDDALESKLFNRLFITESALEAIIRSTAKLKAPGKVLFNDVLPCMSTDINENAWPLSVKLLRHHSGCGH